MVASIVLGLAALAAGPAVAPASAADSLTLHDGSVVKGRIVDPSRRTAVSIMMSRAWAEAKIPKRMAAWRAVEDRTQKKARAQRVARLEAWKRERGGADQDDAIGKLIDAELERLADKDAKPSRLMVVSIDRREVKQITKSTPDLERLLSLGWRSGLKDVEGMTPAELKTAVQGRGFLAEGGEEPSLDDLLPLAPESDERWGIRRAATEVTAERSLRFVRYQGLLMPEGVPGQAPAAQDALGALKGLLGGGEAAEDPLIAKAKTVADRGRRGMVVTSLEIALDASAVQVESTLWVRSGQDRWDPAVRRPAQVRTDDLKPGAGEELIADPQVKAVFEMVEGLGLGGIDPDLKRRSLGVGAATRLALHQAQSALDGDIQAAALPIGEAPAGADRKE